MPYYDDLSGDRIKKVTVTAKISRYLNVKSTGRLCETSLCRSMEWHFTHSRKQDEKLNSTVGRYVTQWCCFGGR
ncbi:hypothetical protein GCM10007105_30680 [Shewanella chilikensis]|nr:hypothetical protein GCM10007105_30680 [Shewanella chilikensis]